MQGWVDALITVLLTRSNWAAMGRFSVMQVRHNGAWTRAAAVETEAVIRISDGLTVEDKVSR